MQFFRKLFSTQPPSLSDSVISAIEQIYSNYNATRKYRSEHCSLNEDALRFAAYIRMSDSIDELTTNLKKWLKSLRCDSMSPFSVSLHHRVLRDFKSNHLCQLISAVTPSNLSPDQTFATIASLIENTIDRGSFLLGVQSYAGSGADVMQWQRSLTVAKALSTRDNQQGAVAALVIAKFGLIAEAKPIFDRIEARCTSADRKHVWTYRKLAGID